MHAAAMSSAVSPSAASYAGASPARRARRRRASIFLANDSDIRHGVLESILLGGARGRARSSARARVSPRRTPDNPRASARRDRGTAADGVDPRIDDDRLVISLSSVFATSRDARLPAPVRRAAADTDA